MSTLEREVMDAEAVHPSTFLALVPLAAKGRVVEGVMLPRVKPDRAHVYFYTIGYAGLGLIAPGAWVGARSYGWMMILYLAAAFCTGLGGLGVLVHVMHRPSMPKLRKGMGAVAALVLTVAAVPVLDGAAVEVYAASLVPRLQPLAEDLARHGRVREMEHSNNGWKRLNGFKGVDAGPEAVNGRIPGQPYTMTFEDALRGDGIARVEHAAFERRMAAAGMDALEVGEGYLVFRRAAFARWHLLHVLAGHPLPSRGTLLMGWPEWRLLPLGGGWYVIRSTGRTEYESD